MSIAFVFPGQGSQAVGMLSAFAATEPTLLETFAEASDVLGYDLWELCQSGPDEVLGQTENTQPAMLTAGVATWRIWQRHGGARPALTAGHSLGEYTALVCAGSLAFRAAVDLVRYRGQVMQHAVPLASGAMAAILGLDDAAVEAVCDEAADGEVVVAANYNAPGQVVIAGHTSAVDRAIERARGRGAKRALRLPVSAPSHSPLMRPAAEQLLERLRQIEIRKPQEIEVYAVDLGRHTDPQRIAEALVEQLYKPVRWVDTVRDMIARGAQVFVECGPGKVLTGLNRRIERNKDIATVAIEDPASLEQALTICRGLAA